MNLPSETLGMLVRRRRKELRLSLRALAKQVGVAAPFVCDVEKGFRFPSDETLEAMAAALMLDPALLRESDPRPPTQELQSLCTMDPRWAAALRHMLRSIRKHGTSPQAFTDQLP